MLHFIARMAQPNKMTFISDPAFVTNEFDTSDVDGLQTVYDLLMQHWGYHLLLRISYGTWQSTTSPTFLTVYLAHNHINQTV